MIYVHPDFRPHLKEEYPPENDLIFEEWFYQNFKDAKTEREYLPIFWTSFYVQSAYYGKDRNAMEMLQRFIDGLDRNKKYFTVLQYDDGILNDVSKLDLKVFGSGNIKTDYPLPLLCNPHKYVSYSEKTIFASFRGNYNHSIRTKMKKELKYPRYRITDERMNIVDYCQELSQSTFALCPRGYGVTSFRIMEAIQQGSIPVYISDKFIFPHGVDFESYGVVIKDYQNIDSVLSGISLEEIKEKQSRLPMIYKTVYDYQHTLDLILHNAN